MGGPEPATFTLIEEPHPIKSQRKIITVHQFKKFCFSNRFALSTRLFHYEYKSLEWAKLSKIYPRTTINNSVVSNDSLRVLHVPVKR